MKKYIYQSIYFKNITVFKKQLKKYVKPEVLKYCDFNLWLEDVINSAYNGYSNFEISKQYTKSGLPELIRFGFYDNTIEF